MKVSDMRHSVSAALVGAAFLLGAPAWAATFTSVAVGAGFVDQGSGFVASAVPGSLRTGVLTPGSIEPGTYRAAFEFDVRPVPKLATIKSARLLLQSFGPPEQRGRQVLSAYFGDGVLTAADVSLTLESLVLDNAAFGVVYYDVTSIFSSFYQIGATHLGFSAFQDPLGVCVRPYFGSCGTILGGPYIGDGVNNPQLVVDYAPFVVPPVDGVPEPETWLQFIIGFALTGLAWRLRFKHRITERSRSIEWRGSVVVAKWHKPFAVRSCLRYAKLNFVQ